jgi:Kef-type K+ transport system membrane component KefB
MDSNVWIVASAWLALALMASLLSIRLGVSVALVEIMIGAFAGNVFDIATAPWIDFLATFGAVLLTFLAGAELEPNVLRRHWKPAVSIGFASFLAPFVLAMAFAYWIARWDLHASYIAGIALSTTSVAVVYATMLETGLNRTELGKLILAACFVTDLGTVLALGLIFANFNAWLALFAAGIAVALWQMPRLTRFVIATVGRRVSEPELKFVFLVLFLLGALAKLSNSEPVLPAYLLGLVVAGVFAQEKVLLDRMRAMAFTILTPFYFLKAGLLVQAPAIAAGAALIAAFLATKVAAKFVGVAPLTRLFGFAPRDGTYITLLMSTGLTFGSISALFGLTNHIIDRRQYTILVTVVIASAVVPTLVAQRWFHPAPEEPVALTAEEAIPAIEEASEIP